MKIQAFCVVLLEHRKFAKYYSALIYRINGLLFVAIFHLFLVY
jgi:hypothetical protein